MSHWVSHWVPWLFPAKDRCWFSLLSPPGKRPSKKIPLVMSCYHESESWVLTWVSFERFDLVSAIFSSKIEYFWLQSFRTAITSSKNFKSGVYSKKKKFFYLKIFAFVLELFHQFDGTCQSKLLSVEIPAVGFH